MSTRRVALNALSDIIDNGAYANLCLKRAEQGLSERDAKWVSAAVYCAGLVLARIIRGQWIIMNINDSIYDSYVFNILLALAGTLAAFMLVQFIPFPRFVKALGRNTLFYYAFHNQACSAVTYALSLISGFTINRQFLACDRWLWLAIVAVALVLMALPCWVVNKCAPFLVGKKMSETGCIWLKTGKKKS